MARKTYRIEGYGNSERIAKRDLDKECRAFIRRMKDVRLSGPTLDYTVELKFTPKKATGITGLTMISDESFGDAISRGLRRARKEDYDRAIFIIGATYQVSKRNGPGRGYSLGAYSDEPVSYAPNTDIFRSRD
jgi:hypothetical protein